MGDPTLRQDLLTIEELATYLGFTVGTIYKWNSNGDGPDRVKIGNRVFYRRVDVVAWVEERETVKSGRRE